MPQAQTAGPIPEAPADEEVEGVAVDCVRELRKHLRETVRCGDCKYFVRDGKCGFLATPEGRDKSRPFSHAPFWVWSDCYSDREQVRAAATSRCSTFAQRQESPNV